MKYVLFELVSRFGVRTTWTREGFDRVAAALSIDGDRCLRHVQCRDGRSRGKACCCASRINVRIYSRCVDTSSFHLSRVCSWSYFLYRAFQPRGFRHTFPLFASAAEVRVSPERWVLSLRADSVIPSARAFISRSAWRDPCRYPASLSFLLRRTSLRIMTKVERNSRILSNSFVSLYSIIIWE